MNDARAMIVALDLFDASAAALTKDRQIVARTRRFGAFQHVVQIDATQRLVASDHSSELKFSNEFQRLAASGTSTCPLRGGDDPDCIAHLRHVTDTPNVFAILLLTSPCSRVEPASPDVLSEVFGLTSAESRLASALAANHTVPDAAALCGLTTKSARSSIEKIYTKVGVSRQTDLIMQLSAARATF